VTPFLQFRDQVNGGRAVDVGIQLLKIDQPGNAMFENESTLVIPAIPAVSDGRHWS
jgi:hypothetical protein